MAAIGARSGKDHFKSFEESWIDYWRREVDMTAMTRAELFC